jgi:hypothetical protein
MSMAVSCNEKTTVFTTVQRSEYKINKHHTTHTRYEQATVLMQVQYVCSVLQTEAFCCCWPKHAEV